jgi:hypothetical protein
MERKKKGAKVKPHLSFWVLWVLSFPVERGRKERKRNQKMNISQRTERRKKKN